MLRTNIEFSCDMPYDAVEADGEFVQMPGRAVAEAMAEILTNLGCAVEPVESAGDHGWLFWFKAKSVEVACEVTVIDGVVAQFSGPRGDKVRLTKGRAADQDYIDVLTAFGRAIEGDPRFRDVGWFSSDELTSGQVGARTPTGPYDPSPCIRTFGQDVGDAEVRGPTYDIELQSSSDVGGVASEKMWGPAAGLSRLSARMFDHLVIVGGMLLLAIHYFRIPPPIPAAITTDYNGYILFVIAGIVGGVVNACLVHWTSTTPGKWLCRLRVVRADEAPLGFAAALKREAETIAIGCGMFIPLLMPVGFVLGLFRITTATGQTRWDRRSGAIVQQVLMSEAVLMGMVFCVVASFVLAMALLAA